MSLALHGELLVFSKHNRNVSELISRLASSTAAASTRDELLAVLNEAVSFDSPIKFDNKILAVAAIAFFCGGLAAAVIVFLFHKPPGRLSIGVVVVIFAAALVCIALLTHRNRSVSKLSQAIFHNDLLLDNKLKIISTVNYLSVLQSKFSGFRLGDHSNELRALYSGHHEGAEHHFDYLYYHYHYVNKRTEYDPASTDRGARHRRSRTKYDHFDRYGIILSFGTVTELMLRHRNFPFLFGRSGYRTASNRFNKLFKVVAKDELVAAKFLVPKIILECEKLAEQLDQLSYEFNHDAELCMSFKDKDLLWAKRLYGLDSLELFMRELDGFTRLPKLNLALDHIHTLMKYSDNNFSHSPVAQP